MTIPIINLTEVSPPNIHKKKAQRWTHTLTNPILLFLTLLHCIVVAAKKLLYPCSNYEYLDVMKPNHHDKMTKQTGTLK